MARPTRTAPATKPVIAAAAAAPAPEPTPVPQPDPVVEPEPTPQPEPSVEPEPVAEATQEETQEELVLTWELFEACVNTEPKFAGPSAKESGTQFCARMMQQLSGIPDDAFEALSDDAKNWYNAFGEALNQSQPTPEPDGLADFMAQYQAPKAAKVDAPRAPAAPKEPKAPKAPPPPKEPKAPGVVATVRRLIVENSEADSATIREKANALLGEIKDTTFSAIMTDTMATINLAKQLGFWKELRGN